MVKDNMEMGANLDGSIFRRILESVHEVPVIDTHEHLENEEKHMKWNVLSDYTQHYFSSDLISAGLPLYIIPQLAIEESSIIEKWDLLQPYWENSRYTGYGQVLDIAAQMLYGVEKINRDTIEAVENGYQKLRQHDGFSSKMLREHGVVAVMNNIWRLDGESEGGLYHYVNQIDDYVMIDTDTLKIQPDILENLRTIDDWVINCLDTLAYEFKTKRASALKLALAYKRSLCFENPSHQSAEDGYQAYRCGKDKNNPILIKCAQDYVLHSILKVANDNNWLVQIHLGYQEGNENDLRNANPEHIINLLRQYPNVRYDLFHMGYPYQHITGALGKMFPNVRLNLCWAHMLSPIATMNALREWLYTVPINKIFAFGGDCRFFDGTIGHLELARRNISKVLAGCVCDGLFTCEHAIQIAKKLFYDNPRDFYQFN